MKVVFALALVCLLQISQGVRMMVMQETLGRDLSNALSVFSKSQGTRMMMMPNILDEEK